MKYAEKDVRRFWSKVDQTGGFDACWIWMASRTSQGYGHFWVEGKLKIASRMAWEITNGEIPLGEHVLHSCDNPPCCNLLHLFLGTNHDNVLDSLSKGRRSSRKAERNGRHKLSFEQVLAIRECYRREGISQRELAAEFGVSQVQIGHIVNNKAWTER